MRYGPCPCSIVVASCRINCVSNVPIDWETNSPSLAGVLDGEGGGPNASLIGAEDGVNIITGHAHGNKRINKPNHALTTGHALGEAGTPSPVEVTALGLVTPPHKARCVLTATASIDEATNLDLSEEQEGKEVNAKDMHDMTGLIKHVGPGAFRQFHHQVICSK